MKCYIDRVTSKQIKKTVTQSPKRVKQNFDLFFYFKIEIKRNMQIHVIPGTEPGWSKRSKFFQNHKVIEH
jgi:hypothetical protein